MTPEAKDLPQVQNFLDPGTVFNLRQLNPTTLSLPILGCVENEDRKELSVFMLKQTKKGK
jgi:hypothetical protein